MADQHVPLPPPEEEVRTVAVEFMRLLIIGRWVVLATIGLVLALRQAYPVDEAALLAVGAVTAAYNLANWYLVVHCRWQPPRPWLLITIDLLLITALDWFSGGVRSPFLDLYYLIIIVAAAFYEHAAAWRPPLPSWH